MIVKGDTDKAPLEILSFNFIHYKGYFFYNFKESFALEKCSITELNAQGGFTPAAVAPRRDNSRNGATLSSLSAGAAWGDRHCPLLHSYQHLEFHINGKGILKSRIFASFLFFVHDFIVFFSM